MPIKLNWHTPDLERELIYEARVSAPDKLRDAPGSRLIRYLIENAHWSPLQMVNICVEVITTRDIARQFMRHTSFDGVREFSGVQEYSQRYAEPTALGSMVLREARMQHPTNRQMSVECEDVRLSTWWRFAQQDAADTVLDIYEEAINRGIAKEVARTILPEGMTPTRLHLNGTLRTWIHFAAIRRGHGTQPEAIAVANEIWDLIRTVAPDTVGAVEGLAA